MGEKINVMVFASDRTGVSMFRSIEPHMRLQELYGDDFFVELITAGTDNFDWDDETYLKKFHIIHFHRALPKIINGRLDQAFMEESFSLMDKLKGLGITLIMDIDDYWMPGPEHPAYLMLKQQQLDVKITENLKWADYVITTTSIFADVIKKYNKNVVVLPNTIDPDSKQFKSNPEPTDKKLRFGWLGGSSHLHDLSIIKNNVSIFLDEHKEDTQAVLCGFDVRGTITEVDKATKQQKTRKIRPEESVWSRYEEFFTNNYKLLPEKYVYQLKKYDREFDESNDFSGELYRRVWTKPITTYALNYNQFDVSLAPLKETLFNKVKSQLKVIEAGFHKKALIAQNFGPYQIDLVNVIEKGGVINENGNAILIDTVKNHNDWYRAMKKLYQNPDLVDLMKNNLYNMVNEKYHINKITEKRADFYKSILEKKQNDVKQLIEQN